MTRLVSSGIARRPLAKIAQAYARVPVFNIAIQPDRIDQTIGRERMFATLCGCFAVLALVIAYVGLYGTMAYNMARRTNEIGIRMALGAQRRRAGDGGSGAWRRAGGFRWRLPITSRASCSSEAQ